MGRPRVGESELTREAIISAARTILHNDGIGALSLARIAKALNVQTPALYWYFANKAELYTYVVEGMFREMLGRIEPSLVGRELLWALGRAARAQQREVRDAARLISIAGVSDAIRGELVPALLKRIADGGLSQPQARKALTAIQALALGWSIFELNPATNVVMRYSNEGDAAFEEALAELVFGVVPDDVLNAVSPKG